MAKRVVVFDTSTNNGTRGNNGGREQFRKDYKPSTKPTPAAKPITKPAAQPEKKPQKQPKKPKITLDYKTIFRNKLLDDMSRALDNARLKVKEENRSDRTYYAEKIAFLENAIRALNSGEHSFTFLSEAFFWNEFNRIANIIANGPKVAGQVSDTWRKAGGACARVLVQCLNAVRAGRDGWTVKVAPLNVRNTVFFINGTMLYLDRQIKEKPEDENLRRLRRIYDQVYAKSGLKKEGARLADWIRRKDFRKIWKNQETVDYLLEANPETKAEN